MVSHTICDTPTRRLCLHLPTHLHSRVQGVHAGLASHHPGSRPRKRVQMPHRPRKQVQVKQEGSSGVGGLELVPCPPSSLRGEAQLEEAGTGTPPPCPREWDSRISPLLKCQGHRMEQWKGCGSRWAVVWWGRGLVRDAQGLRWGRDSGCEGLGTLEFTGVKLGRAQWSLRCQESQKCPPCF